MECPYAICPARRGSSISGSCLCVTNDRCTIENWSLGPKMRVKDLWQLEASHSRAKICIIHATGDQISCGVMHRTFLGRVRR